MAKDRQMDTMRYASIRDWNRYAEGFDKHVSGAITINNNKVEIILSNHRQDTRGVMTMADIRMILPIPR